MFFRSLSCEATVDVELLVGESAAFWPRKAVVFLLFPLPSGIGVSSFRLTTLGWSVVKSIGSESCIVGWDCADSLSWLLFNFVEDISEGCAWKHKCLMLNLHYLVFGIYWRIKKLVKQMNYLRDCSIKLSNKVLTDLKLWNVNAWTWITFVILVRFQLKQQFLANVFIKRLRSTSSTFFLK